MDSLRAVAIWFPKDNALDQDFPDTDANDKSSMAVLSPQLFSELSPSARMSKGFLILGTKDTTRHSCSTRTGQGSNVPGESTQLFWSLDNTWFKSRRQLGCWEVVLPRKNWLGEFARPNSPHVEALASPVVVWPMPALYYLRVLDGL